jgi:ubiquinone/menaquinone biosynthesis C-methylase UbiE
MHRVLRKNGRFVLLDMARPEKAFWLYASKPYFAFIRLVGSLMDARAYAWLVGSIYRFDRRKAEKLLSKRFRNVRVESLPSDIAFIITGEK